MLTLKLKRKCQFCQKQCLIVHCALYLKSLNQLTSCQLQLTVDVKSVRLRYPTKENCINFPLKILSVSPFVLSPQHRLVAKCYIVNSNIKLTIWSALIIRFCIFGPVLVVRRYSDLSLFYRNQCFICLCLQAQMTNQASPVEEQEKLLDEALNIVKVQVCFYVNYSIDWTIYGRFTASVVFFIDVDVNI